MSRLGSQPASSRRIAVPKPKSDVYVALLAISLGALIVACILLALEMNRYQWKVTPPKAAVDPRPGPALALSCAEKGVRYLLCQAPYGPFRQKVPDTFFRTCDVLEGADTVEAAHILVPAVPLA